MIFHTKKTMIAIIVLFIFSMSIASDMKVGGFLFMLGSKTLNSEEKTKHNLDVFLGLADVNFSAKTEKFEGFTEVYLWPVGYGFSYIESADLDESTNKIVTKKADESKITVVNAWGRFTTKTLQIQIGRSLLKYSNGFFFGDYLHRGSGPEIDYSGSIQNCLQFQNTYKAFTTSVLLGVNDINLDKGYLTFREVIKPTEASEFAIGYQGNIFDPIQDENAEVLNNLSLSARVNYLKEQSVYAEFGMRGLGAEKEDTKRFPFMLGFSVPTGKVLTNLSFEIEYDDKREEIEERSSFEFGVSAVKAFNDHFISILSLNNGNEKDAGIMGLNFELIVLY